mgnify:CR=1 FL=1
MGLDVSYYSNVRRIPDEEIPQGVEPFNSSYDKWSSGYNNKGISLYYLDPDRGPFGGHMKGLEPGWYEVPSGWETGYLRGGSYSGYNTWRNDLALAAGYPGGSEEVWEIGQDKLYQPDSPPFLELINFSDAEGVIGPDISKKLYDDFVNYENKVKKEVDNWYLKVHPTKEYSVDDNKWFLSKYEEWKKAFKTASEDGFVSFH